MKGLAMMKSTEQRMLLLLLTAAFLICGRASHAGALTREIWWNINGVNVTFLKGDPRFPNSPSETHLLTDVFEVPSGAGVNYGQRIVGYVVPPVSGNYTFWISSDDYSELWLSTDDNPANQRRIGAVTGWTAPREWGKEVAQKSALMNLQAHRPYYLVVYHKQGLGDDHLAVRWSRPDGVIEEPIPMEYFRPANTVFTAPDIVKQPADLTVIEGQPITISVEVADNSPSAPQWQRNTVDIPGANSHVLTLGPATIGDENALFRVVLTNQLGLITSAEAKLTVIADTTKPKLVSVANQGLLTIRVVFDERVDQATATATGNYRLTGQAQVVSAALEDEHTVLLTTTRLTPNQAYTLTVNAVKDRAALGNTILPDSTANFVAMEFTPREIGGATDGEVVMVPGGFDVKARGADLGGRSDQFHFGFQERSGDFDVRVRLARLTVTDPYVQAGLVARENFENTARFAGVFASSPQLGCFFESRTTVAAASALAAPPGGFPVNYPWTWLRLRRSGSLFTGYASLDGKAWQSLGSATLTFGSEVLFGLAVASHRSNSVATAEFRDFGPTSNATDFVFTKRSEPLGPSNRRTGLIFSEIMYHPPDREDGKNLEFIEIYNAESIFVDFTGWRISGAVDYKFPDGYKLAAGDFVVVAADPAAVEAVYGLRGVLGPFTGRLNNAGDVLRLRTAADALRLEVEYSPDPPWPVEADGAGHSLILARPSYGENDVRSWAASARMGGSPGNVDAITPNPWEGIVINEILAHTDDPVVDFIELYNASNNAIDLSGCFLSDAAGTNKFTIRAGTILQPRRWLAFTQNDLGFALSAAGETIFLISADRSRVLDAVRFGPQENNVSFGRAPDGGPTFRRLTAATLGAVNAPWRVEDVVINEIMYHPLSEEDDDQYVELHNRSNQPIDLSGWSFVSGITFTFPSGASLPAGGHMVVARNVERLRGIHAHLNAANSVGNFSGTLNNSQERVTLAKPDTLISTNASGGVVTNTILIAVSEVTYRDGGRWPALADGGGSSLELIDPDADLLRPSNWAASDETEKAPWTTADFTGLVTMSGGDAPANRFQIIMLGAGECLIDDVQVFRAGSTNLLANPGFELTPVNWTFFGNHSQSTIDTTGAFAGTRCLHVRSLGDGDTANNAIRANLGVTIVDGNTVTIRAKIRWLAGWPEVLLRVRRQGIELPVRMNVPLNLGTPGLPNSRRVTNAGPAIYDVTHSPAVPRANQSVVVTCRASDSDGVAAPRMRFRVDPSTTASTLQMRDDGLGGDVLAGDGVFSAIIPGRASGVVGFWIEASDDGTPGGSSTFPGNAPARECLVRWNDPMPFGTFAQYHMWNSAATESARNRSRRLDNTYQDCTLVYGDFRVVYNAGFRDKGSPFHGGAGDFAVTVPRDEMILGTDDRVFASTGNGGSENTGMLGDVSAWIGSQMSIPYLHSHYMRLFRNGTQFREIMYDLEQPDRSLAADWFGGGDNEDEFYKIAIWFEFQDDNNSFSATQATLQRFPGSGPFRLARYRWNWQPRPGGNTANEYTPIFNLAAAANNSADRITQMMNLANMEEWMRVFAFHRVIGNWDSWTFNVGQNMYIYTPLGQRAVIIPWDIDFVLGLGNGATDALWGGQDPTMNTMFTQPTYQRMLWRAYQDALNSPMLPVNYDPQFDDRRAILVKNNVTGVVEPRTAKSYLAARRNHIQRQLQTADTTVFSITSNGGADFTSNSPTVTLTGTGPIAVATIEVNGIPYPITWTGLTAWRINVPLGAAQNELRVIGRDLRGNAVIGATDTIKITYTGTLPKVQDWVVINEVMYDGSDPDAEFIEIHNRHPGVTFDLSGYQISGVGFTIPAGTFIQPNGFLLFVESRSGFAAAYGPTIPVAGAYSGNLDNDGEMLRLIQPGATEAEDVLIDDLRYDALLPWPLNAAGQGASLQLIDAAQDNWRVGNWAAMPTNHVDRATPGRVNATRNFLPEFPPLWLNEVLPNNETGAQDNAGEREPWIEIFNSGASPLDLSGYFLSDDAANLTKWQFPSGTTLGSGQFLLVWADGETAESTPTALHTNFRLNPATGVVTLSRIQLGVPAAMDYARYVITSPDRTLGSFPDGEPRRRRVLFFPTPGEANNPAIPTVPLFINEWMASNRATIRNPHTGRFEDWFEIFNAGTAPFDVSGFYLTDNVTNWNQFRIPPGTVIPARGHKLVWATGDAALNAPGRDLHTNFRLANDGEQLGLFTPDGSQVDSVTFGRQTDDLSQGRFPDGAAAPFYLFSTATPGSANVGTFANQFPVIDAIADRTVDEGQAVVFRITASDPDAGQTLSFSLVDPPAGAVIDSATGNFSWPLTEGHGPGVYSLTVRVSDNGTPLLSATRAFRIVVREVNVEPVLQPLVDATIEEGSLYTFRAEASDPDLPAQKLTFSLEASAPAGALIDPVTGEFTWTPAEEQGVGNYSITVRVTDDGVPALSATRSFNVQVLEINNPPLITPVSAQSIDENSAFTVQVSAQDTDNPPRALTFALESAPEGAAIDPVTGLFSWTPTEAHGPRDYIVTVLVSEPGGAPSATTSFVIGVREVNTIPVVEAIPDFRLRAGDLLSFLVKVTDSDLPAQTLTFSTLDPLPKGATLDAGTGEFRWQLTDDPPGGTHTITVQVSDDAFPPGMAERTFRIQIEPPLNIVINEIMHKPAAANAEFVELFNFSAENSIDLSHWRMEGYNFVFPAGTVLEPNAFICVAKNAAAFRGAYGNSPRVLGDATVSIAPEGGLIQLFKAGPGDGPEQLIDEVFFAVRSPWPAAAAQGASLQLIDPREDNRRVANWAASANSRTNPPVEIVSLTASWKYWQEEAFPGDTWNTLTFSDTAWPGGAALLFVEGSTLPAPKNTPLTLGQTTYYFRTRFNYSGNVEGARLIFRTVIDDGVVFHLNGNPVFSLGMPDPPISQDTFASRTVDNAALEGPFDVPATGLREGENVIAAEVHQTNAGSSDIVFGSLIELVTLTPASFTPGAPNSVLSDLPPFPSVWINEVLPRNTTGIMDNHGEREPWIELYNSGDQPVSLDDWSLTDSFAALDKWFFPFNTVIPPRGFLLVWADGEVFETVPGQPHTNFRLNPNAGSIALVQPRNQTTRVIVDYIEYVTSIDDQSIGALSDDQPLLRQVLPAPTPRTANQQQRPPRPQLVPILMADGKLGLSWEAKPGVRYRLQTTANLANPNWETLFETVAATSPVSFVDANVVVEQQRFYRVVAE
ncbi:MAG: lamin tail domain-containing protein [Verrucomicrobiota bacterium]